MTEIILIHMGQNVKVFLPLVRTIAVAFSGGLVYD
jgi:hypothetical protein